MAYFLWGLTGVLFLCGQNVQAAVAMAMKNCLYVLVPVIFPSLVLCLCLVRVTGKPPKLLLQFFRFLGLPDGAVLPFLLGMFGGYCTGAKLIQTMWDKGKLSKKQASMALSFCVNPGYGFVAGVLKSDGKWVYLFLLLSSLLVGTMACRKESVVFEEEATQNIEIVFKDALGEGISAMLGVIASVLLFSAVSACIPNNMPLMGLDVTSELLKLCEKLPLAAFLLAFGGLSIFLQVRVLCPFASKHFIFGMFIKGMMAIGFVFFAQKKGAAMAATFGVALLCVITAVKQRAVLWKSRHYNRTKYGRAYHSMQDMFRLQK